MKRFNEQSISDILAFPVADLGPKQDDEPGGDWPVKETVGSLMWLSTMTRPVITNAVRAVGPYAYEPTERLWSARLCFHQPMKLVKNLWWARRSVS